MKRKSSNETPVTPGLDAKRRELLSLLTNYWFLKDTFAEILGNKALGYPGRPVPFGILPIKRQQQLETIAADPNIPRRDKHEEFLRAWDEVDRVLDRQAEAEVAAEIAQHDTIEAMKPLTDKGKKEEERILKVKPGTLEYHERRRNAYIVARDDEIRKTARAKWELHPKWKENPRGWESSIIQSVRIDRKLRVKLRKLSESLKEKGVEPADLGFDPEKGLTLTDRHIRNIIKQIRPQLVK